MNKDLKRCAVRFMGGKCILCGYDRCLRSLHFHHLNPHEKDFDVSSKSTWNEVELELEKCVLLCANCHGEVHDGIVDHETLIELMEG